MCAPAVWPGNVDGTPQPARDECRTPDQGADLRSTCVYQAALGNPHDRHNGQGGFSTGKVVTHMQESSTRFVPASTERRRNARRTSNASMQASRRTLCRPPGKNVQRRMRSGVCTPSAMHHICFAAWGCRIIVLAGVSPLQVMPILPGFTREEVRILNRKVSASQPQSFNQVERRRRLLMQLSVATVTQRDSVSHCSRHVTFLWDIKCAG